MELDVQKWNSLAPRLLAFVRKRVSDNHLAKDIVQDVFMQFYDRGHQLRDHDRLVGWVFAIARNRIADTFREKNRVESLTLPVTEDNNRYNQCVADCLKQELAQLPEKYRQAIELADMKTVPQNKIASAVGMSYSGFKSRVQRARDLLRLRMKSKYLIEHDPYGNIIVCESRKGVSCPTRVR